ncbi:hypothetical protein [Sphingobacterium detergens]|nr:hypothetical protein [Sphingobacterium detergens]
MILSLLAAYTILWYGEPEGFLEIIGEPGFIKFFLINTIALYLLALSVGWLMKMRRYLFLQRNLSAKEWLLLFIRGLCFPASLAIVFAMIYFNLEGKSFSLSNYMKVIFPMVLMVIVCFFALEIFSFFIQNNDVRSGEDTVNNDHRANQLDPQHNFMQYYLMVLINRRVLATDKNGEEHKLPYTTLKEVKELIGEDYRFFSTGSWIVQFEAIADTEKDSNSRALRIYLKLPLKGHLHLHKNDVRYFQQWYNTVKEQ